jgi:cold shock CspA family protein
MTGKIKFFNPSGRWGIIVPDNTKPGDRNTNVFFHEDTLEEGVKDGSLADGSEVEFDLNPNWRKEGEKKAIRVKPINVRTYAPVKEFRSNSTQARGTHAGD